MSLGKCTRIDVSRNVISFGKIFGQTGKEDRPRIFLLTTEPIWAASHGNVKRTFFLTHRVIGSRWGGKRRKYKTERKKKWKAVDVLKPRAERSTGLLYNHVSANMSFPIFLCMADASIDSK